jgi:hypothetical protein
MLSRSGAFLTLADVKPHKPFSCPVAVNTRDSLFAAAAGAFMHTNSPKPPALRYIRHFPHIVCVRPRHRRSRGVPRKGSQLMAADRSANAAASTARRTGEYRAGRPARRAGIRHRAATSSTHPTSSRSNRRRRSRRAGRRRRRAAIDAGQVGDGIHGQRAGAAPGDFAGDDLEHGEPTRPGELGELLLCPAGMLSEAARSRRR